MEGLGQTGRTRHGARRPAGMPYPQDETYRFMVRNVDNFRTGFSTVSEIVRRRWRRRKFLELITVDGDGCWIWMGSASAAGTEFYRGRGVPGSRWKGGKATAFRYLMEEWFAHLEPTLHPTRADGRPGAKPYTVAQCGKGLCIRPQCRRAYFKGYAYERGPEVRTNRRFTEEQMCLAKALRAKGKGTNSIARLFGVDGSTMSMALRGKTYGWCECDSYLPRLVWS